MKDTTFQSSAYGKRENVDTTIDGRVMFDMLPYFFRNHKLSSYSLNSVSAEFLGQQKVRELFCAHADCSSLIQYRLYSCTSSVVHTTCSHCHTVLSV
jgi:DNA polymerase elongation subunit (family B)